MILCKLGLHKFEVSREWIPSFSADIIKEYKYKTKCARCGKIIVDVHYIWDGNGFIRNGHS